MTASPVFSASNLCVTFKSKAAKEVRALVDLNLQIPSGSLFVLLGPNGAGKTTMMRCMTGLVKPTSGSLTLFGTAVERSHLARMGVLIENPGVYNRLSIKEYLEFFAGFYVDKKLGAEQKSGVDQDATQNSPHEIRQRIKELAEPLDLDLGLQINMAKLSQGNKQKVQLARTLLHRPEFLLWDEPTDHLDPVAQKTVLDYLQTYIKQTGATALVATHRLEQMERVGEYYGFLSQGHLQQWGSADEILRSGKNGRRFKIEFAGPVEESSLRTLTAKLKCEYHLSADEKLDKKFAIEITLPNGSNTHAIAGNNGEINTENKAENHSEKKFEISPTEMIRALIDASLPVISVIPLQASLHDIYAHWVLSAVASK